MNRCIENISLIDSKQILFFVLISSNKLFLGKKKKQILIKIWFLCVFSWEIFTSLNDSVQSFHNYQVAFSKWIRNSNKCLYCYSLSEWIKQKTEIKKSSSSFFLNSLINRISYGKNKQKISTMYLLVKKLCIFSRSIGAIRVDYWFLENGSDI